MVGGIDEMTFKHYIASCIACFMVWALSSKGLTSFEIFVTSVCGMLYYEVILRRGRNR
jgi:hypothetical protein